MKPSVQIERLTQLIRVLEEVRADKKPFNMGYWYIPLNALSGHFIVGDKNHSCGTASCAAGWAAQDPWFKRRGFTLGSWTKGMVNFYPEYSKTVHMRGDGVEFEACETFFGVRDVFNLDKYLDSNGVYLSRVTPSMVIAKVKKLIKSIEAGVGVS